jgi:Tfp pilus assembly protein PilZ
MKREAWILPITLSTRLAGAGLLLQSGARGLTLQAAIKAAAMC